MSNGIVPKISVIVPVYKAEAYLHRCIDSLLAQTFFDFEILLVDDGSPDRSGEICAEYARKDRRVRVFRKNNGGVSSARQCGIDNVVGEYSIHVDPDDWVEPTMLEELYEKAKKEAAPLSPHQPSTGSTGHHSSALPGEGLQTCPAPGTLYRAIHCPEPSQGSCTAHTP